MRPLLPTLRVLNLNPAGELFGSRPSRKLLGLINEERCPDLLLDIISNGTLFSEEEWNKFPGIHGKIRSVRISTDAACKETFETLRRLGKYDVFCANMRFLRGLRDRGVIPWFKPRLSGLIQGVASHSIVVPHPRVAQGARPRTGPMRDPPLNTRRSL